MKFRLKIGDEIIFWVNNPDKDEWADYWIIRIGEKATIVDITYGDCIEIQFKDGTKGAMIGTENLYPISGMVEVGGKYVPREEWKPVDCEYWNEAMKRLADYLYNPKGATMNCPETRELAPIEQIEAKIDELNEAIIPENHCIEDHKKRIKGFEERKRKLTDIVTSLNWKTAPESMQIKAVEVADQI